MKWILLLFILATAAFPIFPSVAVAPTGHSLFQQLPLRGDRYAFMPVGLTSQPVNNHLRVYLITFGPGADPWEKFGHDCIAIEDTEAGTSVSYNWGVFSFGEGISGFLSFGVQFLRGRLLYSMESDPTGPLIDAYIAHGRSVLVQELRLSPAQKSQLQSRLLTNDTEANRYYLYDYFKRNCATMCRDAIDQSIGGQAAATLTKVATNTTYRWQDRRATADTLWLYTFLDFALGHGVDLPLSAWEESFLPGQLAEHLREVNVSVGNGKILPLVKWEKQLTTGTFLERTQPPHSYFYYFIIAGFTAAGGLVAFVYLGRKLRFLRLTFKLLIMFWSLVAGLLGALLTYAWFSDHLAAKWNENWLQANPLSLLLLAAIPLTHRRPILASRISAAVALLSLIGLIAKVTPWGWQSNGAIIAIALPIHLATAWGLNVCDKNRTTKSASIGLISNPQPMPSSLQPHP